MAQDLKLKTRIKSASYVSEKIRFHSLNFIVRIVFFRSIIRIDTSVMKDQLTDFSGSNNYYYNEDCGCYGPPASVLCLEIYKPVCGCDGFTYDNACEAYNAGIKIYYRGECRKLILLNRSYSFK